MDNLAGKTILIGKDPQQSRLCIVVKGDAGKALATMLGEPGSVPACVSRCIPQQGAAHASITVDADGTMTLRNLKPQNVSFVDGLEVAQKRISPDSHLELGKDRYQVALPTLLAAAEKLAAAINKQPAPGQGPTPPGPGPEEQQKYNIAHLAKVWDDYQAGLRAITKKQQRINTMRYGGTIFGTMAAITTPFIGPVALVFTACGGGVALYSLIGMKNDDSVEQRERVIETFQDSYICPHCSKFLGNYSYKLMKKQYSMHCPYCKVEFEE
jgi:DNA-directed RNA polymerase subunit RPC12/RpoP